MILNRIELEASAEKVFALFEDEQAWPRWFAEISEVTWTSARPFGVGTTRTVVLQTLTVHEHFFLWEPGRRFAFYFTGHTRPLLQRFFEDYQLEDLEDGRCRFTWRVGFQPRWWLRPATSIFRRQFDAMFQRAIVDLETYVHKHLS